MHPLISLLVPCYNHGAYVAECIHSVLRQPYPRIELIIINDGSTDNSAKVIKDLSAKYQNNIERFVFIDRPHEGVNKAFNAGIAAATGDYFSVCCADDILSPDRFSEQVTYLESHPEFGVVYSNGSIWDGANAFGPKVHPPEIIELIQKPTVVVLDYLLTHISPIYVPTALFRRDIILASGGYDESVLTDDWVLNIRIFQALIREGKTHSYLELDTFGYRMHPNNSFRNFPDQFRRSVEPICHYTPPEKRAEFLQRVFWQFGMSAIGGKRATPFSQFVPLEKAHSAVVPTTIIQIDRNTPKPAAVYSHLPRQELLSQITSEPKLVIDIGCNTGASCEWIKQKFPNCTTVGIEINPHAVSMAEKHVDILIQKPVDNISWDDHGVAPGTVDVILIADVLEHLENPWLTLSGLKELLSPNGIVLASIPNARNLWLIDHLSTGSWTYTNDGLLDATHLRFFTRKEIERLFKKTGYSIQAIHHNLDPRLVSLLDSGHNSPLIETEKIILKDVSQEERIDLATLQFLVKAQPSSESDFQPQTRRVRIGILTADNPNYACYALRISDPLSLLSNYVDIVRLVKTNGLVADSFHLREDLVDGCDVFIVQRLFPSQDTKPILEKIFNTGKPVIYETDDLLDEIQSDNPMYSLVHPRIPQIHDTIRRATAVTLSTARIKNQYSRYNSFTKVFSNQLSEERWQDLPAPTRAVSTPIVIGFAGSKGHRNDLKLIESAILKAARHFGNRVRFVFWGAITDDLLTLPNCDWINTEVSYSEYPRRLSSLGLDIGLAPLGDTPFNACKSDIKWLEYSIIGVPSICSDIGVYDEPKDQRLAIVVPNDEDAWFRAITTLVENTELRKSLGTAAQTYVREHRLLSQHIAGYARWLNHYLPEGLHIPTGSHLQLEALSLLHGDEAYISAEDYDFWREKHQLQEVDAEVLAERMMRWPNRPTIAVLMVVKGTEIALLAGTIDSLQRQLYPHWKLIVISDQPSPDPVFETTELLGWLQTDSIDDSTVAQALSGLLPVINTEFFCQVPVGTQFEPHSFVLALDFFQRHPDSVLVYTDHDFVDRKGQRRRPAFKPDFNLDLLRSINYINDAVFFRNDTVVAAGGIQPYPGAENFDLTLRLLDIYGEKAIGHIAEPLFSFPAHDHSPYLQEASLRVAIEAHLMRNGVMAEVGAGLLPGTLRVMYEHDAAPLVSIIIPNRDKIEVLEPCLESLFGKTSYQNFEVIVVDNQSEDPDVLALYAKMGEVFHDRFRVVSYDAPFNFAAQVNLGATNSHGEVLLLLNNDCEVIQPDWLDRMLHHALRPEVGAVGPMLIAPENGQVQQAGILLGPPGGLLSIANHAFAGTSMQDTGYLSRLQVDQNYSAVTAACLLIRRNVFSQVGGFDAENFAVLMNDVDFCLRVAKAGYKNVWTPYARLVHHEGRSLKGVTSDPENILRSLMRERQEFRAMLHRWLPVLAKDPAGNRHLSLKDACMHLESRVPLNWEPEIHDRNRVLGFPLPGGSGEYRVAMPLRALAQAGFMHTEVVQPLGSKLPEISVVEMARQAPDTLLLHSTLNTAMQETLPVWQEFFPNMRIVFGLDDRVDSIPEKSSAHLGHKRHFSDIRLRLRKILKLCSCAVVSTEPLAEMVKDMIDDVRIIPNALERSVWSPLRSKRRAGNKPRVGWVGAQQHRGDLELIYEVVKATANDVDWVFMGMWLPEFAEFVRERHQFVAFKHYPEKMASLNLDLALAPLELNEFNEAKSNLRLLEYGILGFPVICTDIFPYRTQNAPATHLPNDPRRWVEAIQDKIRDMDQLAREGDALRTWVLDNFMMDQHVNAWYDALTPQNCL